MSWLYRIASPFQEHELFYGPQTVRGIPKDIPSCPQALVIVDVQEEFNQCINFNCRQFLQYLKKCSKHGTEFHVVYDDLGKEPEMFASLGPVYYNKSYGADPYEGVTDKQTGQIIDASDMEDNVLYYDQLARLDIFRSYGHEYQHVYPDMEKLVQNIKGKQIVVVGGAQNECLRDITHWLNLNNVKYDVLWQFTY